MLCTLLEARKNMKAHILADVESVKFLGDQRPKSHYKDTNNKVLLE